MKEVENVSGAQHTSPVMVGGRLGHSENPSLPESQVMFREVAGYRGAVEEGMKSRSKGFITSQKVWNEGSTPDEELERNLKKKRISH